MTLAPGGTISGVLTNSDGTTPAVGIAVRAFIDLGPSAIGFAAVAFTDASGQYTLRGLPYGNYVIGFYLPGAQADLEFYNDVQDGWENATRVQVGAGSSPAGINASLELAGPGGQ